MNVSTNFSNTEQQSFFAGTEISPLTTSVTLAAGQGTLKKGAVIGKVKADGKFKLVDKAATDGSEVASLVLAEEVDTTGADIAAVAYKRGIFRSEALYVAKGDTLGGHIDELRNVSIYIKTDY
ncbi:head decoration protein [Paenibacillus azoreducens]|uniref:head decoration protein n=1 Tax=Paenibacillus azoreducens TaxID=116718 RepID=UPI0039F53043